MNSVSFTKGSKTDFEIFLPNIFKTNFLFLLKTTIAFCSFLGEVASFQDTYLFYFGRVLQKYSIFAKSSFYLKSMSPYTLFLSISYHFLTCNVLIRKWHSLFEDCLQCLVWWCQSIPLERTPLQRSWRWILTVRNAERRLVWKYMVQSTHANRVLSPQSRPCLAGSRPQSRQFSSARIPVK